MRVVTWNMNASFRSDYARAAAWAYLRDALGADIAVVQEAVSPVGLGAVYRPIGDGKDWGSAVVTFSPRYSLRPRVRRPIGSVLAAGELCDSRPGTTAVADVVDAA
jgi:hypothetical protein